MDERVETVVDRRSFLGGTAVAAATALAGCTDGGFGASEDSTPEPVTDRTVTGAGDVSVEQFQGDPANSGRLEAAGPDGPVETYWRRSPGLYGNSQPAVVDERVYVTFGGDLACLGLSDGERQWTSDAGHDGRATPAVHDGTVYTTVWNGGPDVDRGLAALDAGTGEVHWRGLIDADVTTSPTVTGNGVFIGGGFETRTVAAFDHDGTRRWVRELAEYASTPAVAGGTVYYGAGDARVVTIDAATGERSWTAETDGETTAAPTVVDGRVFVGTREGTLYALDAGDGTERWSVDLPGGLYRSAAVAGDRVVAATRGGLVAYGLDGTEHWTAESLERTTAPVVAGDTVYVGDGKSVRALSLANGESRWSFDTRERQHSDVILQGIRSAPAVAAGVVLVATQAGDVYALGSEENA